MIYLKSLGIVVASSLLFSGIGGMIGYLLGRFLPDYYRSVSFSGMQPGFNPVAYGDGQGVTQGLAGGAVIGLIVSAIAYCALRREGQV